MFDPDELARKRYRASTFSMALALAGVLILLAGPVFTALSDDSEAAATNRRLGPINVGSGDHVLGGAALGYRFAVPEGFAPVLDSRGADVALAPRKWQPVFARLDVTGIDMRTSVKGFDDDALADFAARQGDTNAAPSGVTSVIDKLTAADGSPVVWVNGPGNRSTAYAYRGDEAVRISVEPPNPAVDDSIAEYDRDVFPAATRALVSTLELR